MVKPKACQFSVSSHLAAWEVRDLMFCHCTETSWSLRGFGNEAVSMASTLPQLKNKAEKLVYYRTIIKTKDNFTQTSNPSNPNVIQNQQICIYLKWKLSFCTSIESIFTLNSYSCVSHQHVWAYTRNTEECPCASSKSVCCSDKFLNLNNGKKMNRINSLHEVYL